MGNLNIATQDIPLSPQPQVHQEHLHQHHLQDDDTLQPIPQLHPVDRGRNAWTVLLAGFLLDGLLWGFPMCFGVFQDHYSRLPDFARDRNSIATIGVLAQALYYLGAPFSAALTKRFPKYQRLQIYLGWPLCILGLLAASFTTSVRGLIATQGFLYGLGFATLSLPVMSIINEWWVARKGMAFGLISASSGASSAVLPFILDALLKRYGYRTTLRASAVGLSILTLPLLPLFKTRLPASHHAVLAPIDWSFLSLPLFWIYASAILIQGMGFFYPVVFLPSYASSVGVPSLQGAVLVSLMSVSQVLGQFAFGYLSDKNLSVSLLGVICCVTAAVASLVLWGLAKSIALLAVFSLVYGFFGFGFGTMRVAMGRAVSDDPSAVFAIYATFVFLQGLGNILVGPLSSVMMSSKATVRSSYGVGKYDAVVVLTGATSCLAALIMLLWHGLRHGQRLVSFVRLEFQKRSP